MTEYRQATGFKLTTEEQQRYEELKKIWVARPQSLKDATTAEYQLGKMQRMDMLAMSNEKEREEEFDKRVSFLDWDPSTAACYWSQLIKLAEDVGLPVSFAMRTKAKVLRNLSKEVVPGRPTVPLSTAQLFAVLPRLVRCLSAAVALAFVLGQRMGDTLKLEVGCLALIRDVATTTSFLAIQFRRGKTTRRRQPFSLHLPATSKLATDLLELQAEGRDGDPLFPSAADPDKAISTIRAALQQIDPTLGVLSIRRGGLQHLALTGASTEVLLHHSRHAKLEMLERYLGYGQLALHPARQRFLGALPETATPALQATFLEALALSLRSVG